jgi:hypothetical protein
MKVPQPALRDLEARFGLKRIVFVGDRGARETHPNHMRSLYRSDWEFYY